LRGANAPLQDVDVNIYDKDGSGLIATGKTDSKGAYTVYVEQPDTYNVKYTKDGYTSFERNGIIIDKAISTVPVYLTKTNGNIVSSGYCGDDLRWILYEDGLLEIFGTGDMWNNPGKFDSNWYSISNKIKTLSLEYGMTSIGDDAFTKCFISGGLEIPSSVTRIGDYAFAWNNFSGNLEIPDSVTSIGKSAFEGCTFSGVLIIPATVTSIGESAFESCSNLTDYEVDGLNPAYSSYNGILYEKDYHFLIACPRGKMGTPGFHYNVETIGEKAFYYCSKLTGSLTIPNSVTTIDDYAFEYCSGYNGSLTLSNSLTSIGAYAFSGCSAFTGSLTIPDSVISIGNGAFSGCTGLNGNLKIGNQVTTIGDYAFSRCSSVRGGVSIPVSVISIGEYAFDNCGNLTSIEVDESNVNYASYDGILYSKDYQNLITCPQGKATIPEFHPNVKKIGNHAFDGCKKLIGNLAIPTTLTLIGDYAFYNCTGLTGNLIIPDGVNQIGDSAFSGCSGLSNSLTIPSSVSTIGSSAFSRCIGIDSAYFYGNAPSSFGGRVFNSTANGFTIYYIAGKSGWTTPEWNGYPTKTFNP